MTSNQLEIFPHHIAHNFHVVQKVAGVPVMPVLKADGYGLGAAFMATLLQKEGAQSFAVSRMKEVQALREAGITQEILLMAPCATQADARATIALNLTATIASPFDAQLLSEQATAAGREIPVHLKLDTGFGRYGFLPGEWEQALHAVRLPGLVCQGIYSHLFESFAKRTRHTFTQKKEFDRTVARLKLSGLAPCTLHLANSCAALRFPDMRYDRVRVGSALVGRVSIANAWDLRPACLLRAQITQVRLLPRGHNIGYAHRYATKRPTRIGVVPIGLYDGVAVADNSSPQSIRGLLRNGREDVGALVHKRHPTAFWNGQKLPVLGRVGTTALVLDLSHHPVQPGDLVAFSVNPMLVNGSLDRIYSENE